MFDWQWSDNWPVTTASVLPGTRRIRAEPKLVLFFINVTERVPRDLTYNSNASLCGILADAKLKIIRMADTDPPESLHLDGLPAAPHRTRQDLQTQLRQTQVREISC